MTDELAQPSQHPVMMLYWIAVVGADGRVEKGPSMWQRKKELEISSSPGESVLALLLSLHASQAITSSCSFHDLVCQSLSIFHISNSEFPFLPVVMSG